MDENPYRSPPPQSPSPRSAQPVQSVAFLLAGAGTVMGSAGAHLLYRLPVFHAFGPTDFRLKAIIVMMLLMSIGGGIGAYIGCRWTTRPD